MLVWRWIPEIVTSGLGVGAYFFGLRVGHGPKKKKNPKPICGCGHHYAFHEGTTEKSKCHDTTSKWSADRGTYQVPCGCQKYTGPVNVDDFFQLPKYSSD